MTVYANRLSGVPIGGQFCPAQDQIVRKCWSFASTKGFHPLWLNTWQKNGGEREYHIGLAHGKFKSAPGRYYFFMHTLPNGSIEVGDTTYFADLSPGTVVVFTRGNIGMNEAIAYAKEQMSQMMGTKILSLRFIAGGAVSVSCSGSSESKACRIGKQINLSRVSLGQN